MYSASIKSLRLMRGWLAVSKALDWSKKTVQFDLPFPASTIPIAVRSPPFIVGIVCHIEFYAQGCASDSPPQRERIFMSFRNTKRVFDCLCGSRA